VLQALWLLYNAWTQQICVTTFTGTFRLLQSDLSRMMATARLCSTSAKVVDTETAVVFYFFSEIYFNQFYARFDVFTAETMKNSVSWDVTPPSSGRQ
jgi:hypothetical protein